MPLMSNRCDLIGCRQAGEVEDQTSMRVVAASWLSCSSLIYEVPVQDTGKGIETATGRSGPPLNHRRWLAN